MSITQAQLKAILHYDPESGIFTWIKPTHAKIHVGARAGSLMKDGYRRVRILGKSYAEHRLAFLYMTGEMPPEVDHDNRVRNDNRWKNLRAADSCKNKQNVPAFGATFNKSAGKWQAGITANRKWHYLGVFETAEEAQGAYKRAKAELHTFHPEVVT